MTLFSQTGRRRGFTLMELIVSAAIASVILAASYACLRAATESRKVIELRSDATQSARAALAIISADLRCATPLTGDFEFLGVRRTMEDTAADSLDFATLNYTPRRPREGDYCEISYFIDRGSSGVGFSLWRRRDTTLDPEPLEGGGKEELIPSVAGMRFQYYDGFEWFDEWGDATGQAKAQQDQAFIENNLIGMPEAVRVKIAIDPNPPRSGRSAADDEENEGEPWIILETVARLNLTPMSNSSVSGDSSTSQSGVTTGQPGQ